MSYKKINLLTILFFFLTACDVTTGPNDPTTRITSTNNLLNTRHSVKLRATDKGSIKVIDFLVVLPNNQKVSLLDYNGPADLKGAIQTSNNIPCLSGRSFNFNCPAQLSVGNITSTCTIGNQQIRMRIALFRGTGLKNPYDILSVLLFPNSGCYSNTTVY